MLLKHVNLIWAGGMGPEGAAASGHIFHWRRTMFTLGRYTAEPSPSLKGIWAKIFGSFLTLHGFWGQAFLSGSHSEQQSLAYVHFLCL